MSGCVEKLNIQNSENSTGNSILYMYGMSGFAENWISRIAKIQREIVYIIYVQKVWICRKIEYPELRKFNGKLYTLYMYGTSGFAEKLNIYNCENSIGIVYMIYVRNVWIWRKIEYPEPRKFNGKLCTLYMYGMFGLAKKLNLKNCVN